MADTLYIAIDLFHPAPYVPRRAGRPPLDLVRDEDYSHDRGRVYFVLQPFLIERLPADASPSLLTYLGTWKAADLGGARAVRLLTEPFVKDLPADAVVTPVPFPVGTPLTIAAAWNGQTQPFKRERTLGQSPFRLLDSTLWPEFAASNFMPVPIRKFAHLTPEQQVQLFSWTYGLRQTLQDRVERIAKGDKTESLTPLEEEIFNEYFKDKVKPTQDPPLPGQKPIDRTEHDLKLWRTFLTPFLPKLFETVLWVDPRITEDEKGLNAPVFRYTPDQLRARKLESFGSTVPPTSYHEWLLSEIGRVAAAEKDSAEKDPVTARANNALRRLFGFGERLRFPRPAGEAADRDFMIVQPRADNAPDWFVTNAASLLGQVFRIGPIANGSAVNLTLSTLKVGTADLNTVAGRQAVHDQINHMFDEASTLASANATFTGRLTPTRPDRVFFLPRHARPAPIARVHPTTGQPLHAVPGSLLDALDLAARVSAPPGALKLDPQGKESGPSDSKLIEYGHPRSLILGSELLLGKMTTDWTGISRYARAKVRLSAVPLANAPTLADPMKRAAAYEVTFSTEIHPDEASIFKDGLADPSAQIWVESKGEVFKPFALSGQVDLKATPPVIRDDMGALTALLPSRGATTTTVETANGGTTDISRALPQEIIAVDLVWETGPSVQKHALEATERFNLLGVPANKVSPLLMLERHYEHRVSRSASRLLTQADLALDPAPPVFAKVDDDPAHPILGHFGNFNKLRVDLVNDSTRLSLNHPDALVPVDKGTGGAQFLYDIDHQFSEEVRQSLLESESNRYDGYRMAGAEWRVCGQIEHQYSHKLPLDGSATVRLPLSVDVRSLAAVSVDMEEAKADGTTKPKPIPCLTFDIGLPPAEAVTLTIDNVYLARVSALAQSTPATLRPLYEGLNELQRAVDASDPLLRPVLRLERWNFDNTKVPPRAQDVASLDSGSEAPRIDENMRFVGFAELRLSRQDLQPFLSLLTDQFATFAGAVASQTSSPKVAIPFSDARWQRSGPNVDTLGQTTNAVRLGLRLRRAADQVIGSEYTQARFVPLQLQKHEGDEPIPELENAKLADLADKAKVSLEDYLKDDSALHRSFEWIRSFDETRERALESRRTPAAGERPRDPDRALKLLGESYLYLNFPDDLERVVDDPVRLFHVPFAFLPLRAHPAFGDPQTTLEFAEYLIAMLAALLRGQPAEEIDVVPAPSIQEALAARRELLKLIADPGALADRLRTILVGVDPTLPEVQANALFHDVQRLIADNKAASDSVVRELLAADPSIFVTAKAIALVTFDPKPHGYSEKLHSLQFTKHIREATGDKIQLVSDDTDRFSFGRFFGTGRNRFLVDVLDDRSYDDDYHIVADLTSARTAEDVLEDRNLLGPQKAPSIRCELVHYNPQWVIKRNNGDEKKYLLPSRRFPRTPKPVTPDAGLLSRLRVGDFSKSLNTQFKAALEKAMPASIRLPAAGTGQSLTAKPLLPTRQVVGGAQAEGWHQFDSYVSHYYFVVEPDEEGMFVNDVFEIAVRRSDTAPLPLAPIAEASFEPRSALQQWFVFHRRREEAEKKDAAGKDLKRPDPLPLAAIVAEAKAWLISSGQAPNNDKPLLEPLGGPEEFVHRARYVPAAELSNVADPAAGDLTLTFGNVVAAELMELPDTRNAVLHLAVLDNVWRYQEVRVRVLRNEVDINGDQTLDMNSAFRMSSRASEWVSYGRDTLRFDGRELAADVSVLTPSLTLEQWLAPGDKKDFGEMIPKVARAPFSNPDKPGTPLHYWNQQHILHADADTAAVVLQEIHDRHPRQVGSTAADSGIKERGDVLTKLILGQRPAPESGQLTREISRDDVLTANPLFRVTWLKSKHLPLLEVTWPVRWP